MAQPGGASKSVTRADVSKGQRAAELAGLQERAQAETMRLRRDRRADVAVRLAADAEKLAQVEKQLADAQRSLAPLAANVERGTAERATLQAEQRNAERQIRGAATNAQRNVFDQRRALAHLQSHLAANALRAARGDAYGAPPRRARGTSLGDAENAEAPHGRGSLEAPRLSFDVPRSENAGRQRFVSFDAAPSPGSPHAAPHFSQRQQTLRSPRPGSGGVGRHAPLSPRPRSGGLGRHAAPPRGPGRAFLAGDSPRPHTAGDAAPPAAARPRRASARGPTGLEGRPATGGRTQVRQDGDRGR
ncbi:hypothetical protein M885DRAFT_626190 [Pelagophyceae sp. CCMP2097]|nr:hypothetical protein M885DRAFT_626190 [Pelagophyceae sp. CCMP2097]